MTQNETSGGSEDPTPSPPSRRSSPGWRTWLIAPVAIVIVASGFALRDADRGAQLLRADPDQIPGQPELMAFGVSKGRAVYDAHCSGCHGAARAVTQAANLSDRDYLYGEGLVSDNEKIVLYGIRTPNPRAWNLAEMPGYAKPRPAASEPAIQPLKPGEIDDVVEYLQYLQSRPSDAKRSARGAEIYAGRGGCYDCHGADAQGDPAIGAPNLTDRIWQHGDGGRKATADLLANGAKGVCPSWVGKLSPLRIREVALYVYDLSHRPKPSSRK